MAKSLFLNFNGGSATMLRSHMPHRHNKQEEWTWQIQPEARAHVPLNLRGGLTRRSFVMATLAAGFALAMPPSRPNPHDRADGAAAGEIQITTSDGHVPAYRARPERGTALPVLFVVQEISESTNISKTYVAASRAGVSRHRP